MVRIRDAVVIAPGEAALQRVAGLTLLERAILTLARGGIDRVQVVTTNEQVRAALAPGRDHVRANVAVRVVDAPQTPAGPYLLATADRVFDVDLVRAAAAGLDQRDLAICIDRRLDEIFDLEAAVKARTAGGRVLELGKRIGAWDGIDAGVWAVRAGLGVAEAHALAAGGHAHVVEIGASVWQTVAGPATRKAAEDKLFRALRKRVDGPVSRAINRPVSLFVTRRLVNTRVTPNQMTIVANLIGVLGIALVFRATWLSLALGALCVQLQSILDGCDGELARLKFQSSKFGEWLDNVLDDHVNIGYGIALGHASAVLFDQPFWLWVGIGAAIAYTVHNLVLYAQLAFVHRSGNPFLFRWWFQTGDDDVTAILAKQDLATRLAAASRAVARRDLFLFAFLVLAVLGLPRVALVWYALIAAGHFVLVIVHLLKGGGTGGPPAVAARPIAD